MKQEWKVEFYVLGKPLYKVVRAETSEDAKRIVAEDVVRSLRFHSAAPADGAGDIGRELFKIFKPK